MSIEAEEYPLPSVEAEAGAFGRVAKRGEEEQLRRPDALKRLDVKPLLQDVGARRRGKCFESDVAATSSGVGLDDGRAGLNRGSGITCIAGKRCNQKRGNDQRCLHCTKLLWM